MGIKETLKGLVNKKEKSVPTETENGLAIQQIADADLFPIVKIPEISLQKYNKIPISGLASLGAAFSKLPLSARTMVPSRFMRKFVCRLRLSEVSRQRRHRP